MPFYGSVFVGLDQPVTTIQPAPSTDPAIISADLNASVTSDTPGVVAITSPPVVSNNTMGDNIIDFLRSPSVGTVVETTYQTNMQEMKNRYDYAMSKTPAQLAAENIVVTPDNGSLFKDNVAWLPLQEIQNIENANGTAGALMLHMQQIELATQTAGYEGGGTAAGGSTQVTQPIPEVPQPIQPADQPAYVPPSPGTTTPAYATTPTTTTQSMTGTTTGKYWWIWYVVAAIAIVLYIKYAKK